MHPRRCASHHCDDEFQAEREQAESMGQLAVSGPGDVVTVAADTGQERRRRQLDVLDPGGQQL
jgi:hypothetical protein